MFSIRHTTLFFWRFTSLLPIKYHGKTKLYSSSFFTLNNFQVTGGSTTHEGREESNDNNTRVVTVRVPVPIPIPMPFPNITTTTTTTTTCRPTGCCHHDHGCRPPPPVGPDCCVVVVPCIQPCQPYHHVCSEQCISNVMYTPTNPCDMGCQRKPYFIGSSCSMSGYCRQTMNDCSGCSDDFYTSYNGYQQCGRCFY